MTHLTPPAPLPKTRPRRWRAWAFRAYLTTASVAFALLVVIASGLSYFPLDLAVTRSIQAIQSPSFFAVMWAVSAIGFAPQSVVITAAIILLLFASGGRWEALAASLAALGSSGIGTLIKLLVHRPRPAANLILVFRELDTYSFPSGHVLFYTAFFGFLFFLAYILLKPSYTRGVTLVILAGLVGLIGVSRIYLGGHWASDVAGAYLFGSLWLTLSIYIYRWGKPHFSPHQPKAPEVQVSNPHPSTNLPK